MKKYKVALIIEESREIGRGLLRGISQYSHIHGPWLFFREAPFYEELTLSERIKRIKSWDVDGIIMREQGPLDDLVLKLNLPIIYSGHRKSIGTNTPNILGNDEEIGSLAANYFLNKGFKHFAFCGFENVWWSIDRGKHYSDTIKDSDFETELHTLPMQSTQSKRKAQREKLTNWLQNLPKPCALFVATDDLCWKIAEACKQANIYVPEQLALLGVDNDEFVCEFASPPLSSIVLNAQKSGYDAAALLARMMQGKAVKNQTIPIPAPRIETRHSTDIMAIDDPAIAKAMRYIHENYRKGITVDQIAKASGVSRRVLELRFRKAIKRSVYEEVLRLRMDHACTMLTETNLSIVQISDVLNYDDLKYFSRAFKQVIGVPPITYRKQQSICK